MTLRLSEWRGGLPRAVVLAVVMSFIPLHLAAAEERPSSKPGPIKASIEKIAVSDPGTARAARPSATRQTTTQDSGRSGSFFKTKPGIIALAVLIAGAGYAVYSTQNDRITSPGKE